MTEGEFQVRTEPITALAGVAQRLVEVQPLLAERQRSLRDVAASECPQCGIRLNGEELLGLAVGVGTEARLQRLQRGYCARQGCDARFVKISLAALAGWSWDAPAARPDAAPDAEPAAAAARKTSKGWFRLLLQGQGRTAAAGVGVVIVLVVARHWYQGGSIPFLREPEVFQVEVPVAGAMPGPPR